MWKKCTMYDVKENIVRFKTSIINKEDFEMITTFQNLEKTNLVRKKPNYDYSADVKAHETICN